MSDLSEYNYQKLEIERLNKKVRALEVSTSYWRTKYQAVNIKESSRTEVATNLLKLKAAGDIKDTLKEIADKCFLSLGTIKNISMRVNERL